MEIAVSSWPPRASSARAVQPFWTQIIGRLSPRVGGMHRHFQGPNSMVCQVEGCSMISINAGQLKEHLIKREVLVISRSSAPIISLQGLEVGICSTLRSLIVLTPRLLTSLGQLDTSQPQDQNSKTNAGLPLTSTHHHNLLILLLFHRFQLLLIISTDLRVELIID